MYLNQHLLLVKQFYQCFEDFHKILCTPLSCSFQEHKHHSQTAVSVYFESLHYILSFIQKYHLKSNSYLLGLQHCSILSPDLLQNRSLHSFSIFSLVPFSFFVSVIIAIFIYYSLISHLVLFLWCQSSYIPCSNSKYIFNLFILFQNLNLMFGIWNPCHA